MFMYERALLKNRMKHLLNNKDFKITFIYIIM